MWITPGVMGMLHGAGSGGLHRPRLIDLNTVHTRDLGTTTVGFIHLGGSGRRAIVVSNRVVQGRRLDAARHVHSHVDEARLFGEVAGWCDTVTCDAAADWLPIVLTDVASGL